MKNIKYSIIIPVHNGMPYLKSCIDSIISQEYDDYELIVSDDNSTDGGKEYLRSLKHCKIRFIEPHQSLSMTEHWEWALSHAKGTWQIFVGQDDALQKYFFRLADVLTNIADRKNIRAIVAKRAYHFWPGCEYGRLKTVISYSAERRYSIRSTFVDSIRALFMGTYHELPQMYCSSIFHRELLDQARVLQDGNVFSCHPQDANLAAVACTLESAYLKSEIPLGWVGTSKKSAGLAISSEYSNSEDDQSMELLQLREDYRSKIASSKFKYNALAGDFSLASTPIYYWQALLETKKLRSNFINKIISSKCFRVVFFASVFEQLRREGLSVNLRDKFDDLIKINKLNFGLINATSKFIRYAVYVKRSLFFVAYKIPLKIYKTLFSNGFSFVCSEAQSDIELINTNKLISEAIDNRNFIDLLHSR